MTLDRGKLAKLDPVQQNVIVIFEAMTAHQTAPGEQQQTLAATVSLEACIVAAAALLETSADKNLESWIETARDKIAHYARQFRSDHVLTGENGLEQLGAEKVTRITIQ